MQKLADAALSTCPSCGKTNYVKKISAAGFALKGSGWYVTDFRNGSQKKPGDKADSKVDSKSSENVTTADASGAKTATADTAAPVAAPAAPSPAPAVTSAPAPAAG